MSAGGEAPSGIKSEGEDGKRIDSDFRKPASAIFAMRKPGEGWGELARDLKLKNLGSVIKTVKATEKGVDRVALQRSDRREDRLERAAKPDKPERMERPERPMRPEKPGR